MSLGRRPETMKISNLKFQISNPISGGATNYDSSNASWSH